MLDRPFACTTPNQVWVAYITYIPTDEGWLYLAAVKYLYTCEIVGWSMDNRMTQTLVMDALTAAYWKKKPAPDLMHHSNCGSQYCSLAYRALEDIYGIQTSMTRKAVEVARERLDGGTMIRGYCEIAKMLGIYAPEVEKVAVYAENEAMSDEKLMSIARSG